MLNQLGRTAPEPQNYLPAYLVYVEVNWPHAGARKHEWEPAGEHTRLGEDRHSSDQRPAEVPRCSGEAPQAWKTKRTESEVIDTSCDILP